MGGRCLSCSLFFVSPVFDSIGSSGLEYPVSMHKNEGITNVIQRSNILGAELAETAVPKPSASRRLVCDVRPVFPTMAYHPPTPTRVARYMPPTPPAMSTHNGVNSVLSASPASHVGWSAQPPSIDYSIPQYHDADHRFPTFPAASPAHHHSSPETTHFVGGTFVPSVAAL